MIAHYHFCSPRLIPDIREIFSKINPRKSNLMVVVLVHGWMISTLSNYVWLICKNKVKEYIWLSSVEFVSFPVVNIKNGLLAIMAYRTCSKLNKICQIALLFSNIIGLTYRVSNKPYYQNVYQRGFSPNNNANAKYYENEESIFKS